MKAEIMTLKEFRSLGKRDFENGAVKNEIAAALKVIPKLKQKADFLDEAEAVFSKINWVSYNNHMSSSQAFVGLRGMIETFLQQIEELK